MDAQVRCKGNTDTVDDAEVELMTLDARKDQIIHSRALHCLLLIVPPFPCSQVDGPVIKQDFDRTSGLW